LPIAVFSSILLLLVGRQDRRPEETREQSAVDGS